MKHRITITCRPDVAPVGSIVTLKKEPKNEFDDEAIMVEMGGVKIGYVAAVYRTKKPGTISAGRLQDKIGETATATVVAECVAEVECGEEV